MLSGMASRHQAVPLRAASPARTVFGKNGRVLRVVAARNGLPAGRGYTWRAPRARWAVRALELAAAEWPEDE
jgi:hypothetical protein